MTYTNIGCGGGYLVHRGVLELSNGSDRNARSPSSFQMSNPSRNRGSAGRISASMVEIVSQHAEIEKQRRIRGGDGGDRRALEAAREKLDRWMRDSVTEIVKNLSQAPLLVHVYAGGREGAVVTKTEKAEDWPSVKGRWERGEAEMPEGMIFVEQLGEGDTTETCGCGGDGATRAWGLVVQGKGVDGGQVCYLLKTTRVGSGPGIGIWSTHFCLVRVSNFRESAGSQLENCWLVGKGPVVRCGINIEARSNSR